MLDRAPATVAALNRIYESLPPGSSRCAEIARLVGDALHRSPDDVEKEKRRRIEAARFAGPPGHEGDVLRAGDPGTEEVPQAPEPTIPRERQPGILCGDDALWPMSLCHRCLAGGRKATTMRTRRRYG